MQEAVGIIKSGGNGSLDQRPACHARKIGFNATDISQVKVTDPGDTEMSPIEKILY